MEKDFKIVLTGTYEGSYNKVRKIHNAPNFKKLMFWIKKKKSKN